jgi:hypothetical protein
MSDVCDCNEVRDGVCYCPASNAKRGHEHRANGYVLCFHTLDEDASDCPQARKSMAEIRREDRLDEAEFGLA